MGGNPKYRCGVESESSQSQSLGLSARKVRVSLAGHPFNLVPVFFLLARLSTQEVARLVGPKTCTNV